ncbi:NADP-dependent oxidoreductase [Colwellia sp. MB3u-55]|jgi:NADPH:quinone reductase-like Zn-dependent oxidoreductase|uniref:NADP-dependent oxidoreductase n=1 Tax=Colwellia sp. MB3u-55 TaxID=2759810 RepID=UPI0015F6FC2F|nr:NADP-dependent oxidoreductase [Colwellia sp. MB3u-55]MBA6250948.1 NADP-dependent oxidoreductase [Colwellia sp. MB3u-55]
MKAAYIKQYGNVENLIIGDLPKPRISASQVLIKVKAAGVNPVDFHIRNGMLKDSGTHELPLVLGWDAAGIVSEVGQHVTDFKLGDEVYVYSPLTEQGAQAEYLAVNADVVAHKPVSLNFIQSAAVPLAALTALQALTTHGELQKGQKVLIHNASGGVGSFAVQIAKNIGAYVIATGSQAKKDFIMGLGADEFIDYKQDNFEQHVFDMDLVFAAVGGNNIVERSLAVIKPNGRLISLLDEIDEKKAQSQNIHYARMIVEPSRIGLNIITDMLEVNQLQVTIDSVFSLDDAKQAMSKSESARTTGKIVIEVAVN